MKPVLVLVGPTAVGKSSYGVELAKHFNGEIISGDSIQVYRGFDIGSGKVTNEEMAGIPHYLIDVLSQDATYSVADFQRMAREKIEEIHQRGKLPVLVGGTGLYIKACLYDYVFSEQMTMDVDEDLLQMDNEALYELLRQMDPESCKIIHPNNRKRVQRAIMIARTGTTKSDREKDQQHQPIYDVLFMGLTCQRETLGKRISYRVDKMVDAGLKEEIETLLNQGITFQHQAMQGIGYREWQPYFEGKATVEEVKEAIKTHSRQFAKRQYTWFNNQISVQWLDIEKEDWQNEGTCLVENWRKNHE